MSTSHSQPNITPSPHFPDAQHVEALRRALWTDREPGRAAVLVGAGMSRNAVPLRTGRVVMPTWDELTSALIDRLYPDGSGGDRRKEWLRKSAGATSVANRLAEEYAVAFGRHELDALIRESIPDEAFGPGSLHSLLLNLPWADVLTTNYDTLLERSAATVFDRFYSIVRRPAADREIAWLVPFQFSVHFDGRRLPHLSQQIRAVRQFGPTDGDGK